MEMTQAPKLWVPIVATVIFGGAAATTWTWVTTGGQGKTDQDKSAAYRPTLARTMTPAEADAPMLTPSLGTSSMTVDDKFVYIFNGNKLMKVDKTSLELVNSAEIHTKPSAGSDKTAKPASQAIRPVATE
jgi:hypothetical protein